MVARLRPFTLASMGLALVACAAAVFVLAGESVVLDPWAGRSGAFTLRFSAEGPLVGAFLLLVGTVGIASAYAGRRAHLGPGAEAATFAFLLGMVLVPLSNNLFTFMLAWEAMSAAPGLLLVLDEREAARRAGFIYLVYSQLSAFSLLIGFVLWGDGVTPSFDDLTTLALPPEAAAFLLLGAMVKGGVMPFHYWLPEAHPEAPSHVSALMSGVMVALPAYVVARFLLAATVPSGFAMTVLLLGGLSAALGSIHALHARDLKRVLAYTTIAHMGALFALLGLGLLLSGPAQAMLRPFLVTSILAYALSHGWSKGALFLIAGEIHRATGELDLERLGGLWRRLGPLAAMSGLAAVALAGLPPTGGFTAEVSLLTTALASLKLLEPFQGVVVLGALFLLSIGAGAGLAAVAKVTLGAFHGFPRGPLPPPGVHVSVAGPGLLLLLSLGFGLAPGLLLARLPVAAPDAWTLPTALGPLVLLPVIGVGVSGSLVGLALFRSAARRPRAVPPWACGLPPPGPRQTYTPTGLVMPFHILFAEILRPQSDLKIQEAPVAPFAPFKGQYEDATPRYVDRWLHRPLLGLLLPPLERLRRFHRGSVQLYLIVALLVLVFLLFLLPVIQ